jgi:ribosome-binding ATPase YchF (GTP1/OBG family)
MDLAKTAAHPFTTIEPNIGKAFYSIVCPCHDLSLTDFIGSKPITQYMTTFVRSFDHTCFTTSKNVLECT